MARRISASPGSEIPGVPASVTKATFFPSRSSFQERLLPHSLVVFMVADQRFLNPVMGEELAGPPRVFGRDEVYLFQNPQSPQRDILQVADGGGNDVKCAFRFILHHQNHFLMAGSSPLNHENEFFLHFFRQALCVLLYPLRSRDLRLTVYNRYALCDFLSKSPRGVPFPLAHFTTFCRVRAYSAKISPDFALSNFP